jgi:hypothetical protein
MYIIFENGKEHESCGGEPSQVFPKQYADRFRPLELIETAASTPEAQYRNWAYTYEDLGSKVRKTLVLVPKTAGEQRHKRDNLLSNSDHTQVGDYPKKDAWTTYRQKLRDLPTHPNWPDLKLTDWPEPDLS